MQRGLSRECEEEDALMSRAEISMSDAIRAQARNGSNSVILTMPIDQALILADAVEIAGIVSERQDDGGITISLPLVAPRVEPEVLAYRRMRRRPQRQSFWAWLRRRA